MLSVITKHLLGVYAAVSLPLSRAAPDGFPSSGNGLWYTEPATIWSRHYLPIGNGFLGAMTPGGTQHESLQLNIESLWSGGPFADPVNMNGLRSVYEFIE
jgi:alpha-L-fucosidase 2